MTKLTPSSPLRLTFEGNGPATPIDAVVAIVDLSCCGGLELPADGVSAAPRGDARHEPCPVGSRSHCRGGARGDGRPAPDYTVLGALSRPYRRGRLSHLGPSVRIANGARRTRDRPQDRFHQPHHLSRIWRLRAD